jgi:hypothetical protein
MPSLTVLERSSSSREKCMDGNIIEKCKKENAVIRIVIGADNDSLTPLPIKRLKEDDDTSACDKVDHNDDIEDFDDDGSFITIESDCEDSDTPSDFSDGEEGNTGSGSFCINPFFS